MRGVKRTNAKELIASKALESFFYDADGLLNRKILQNGGYLIIKDTLTTLINYRWWQTNIK